MALTTVSVHGELLNLDGLTPAVGTVTFRTLIELRDTVDNITYPPATFTATLDPAGEFTIVLPATDNPDVLPLNWVYQVYINTATWTQTIYVQLPFQVGTIEFADLTPLDYDPCAGVPLPEPLSPSEYDALLALIAALQAEDVALDARLDVVEITMGALVATVNIHTGQITALQNAQTATQADLDILEANAVLKNPTVAAVYQSNILTPPPTAAGPSWLTNTVIPFSAGDNNFDLIRILAVDEFGNTVQTFVLNGNGEPRSRPSARNRVGGRAFESAEAVGFSTGQFWQASSNPTNTANREPYHGVWGTASAKPGWSEATRVLSGLGGVSIGGTALAALAPYNSLSSFIYRGLKTTPGAPAAGTWLLNDVILDSLGVVYRCTVAGTPGTWVAAVPTTLNVTSFTGTTASAALISDGASTGAPYVLSTSYNASENRVWMDGAISNTGGAPIAGGTVLFTVNAAHAPAAWVQFNERTSTTLSARVTVRPDGTVRLDQSLAAAATCSFDGINWRKA